MTNKLIKSNQNIMYFDQPIKSNQNIMYFDQPIKTNSFIILIPHTINYNLKTFSSMTTDHVSSFFSQSYFNMVGNSCFLIFLLTHVLIWLLIHVFSYGQLYSLATPIC